MPTHQGSFRLFRLAGVTVFLHWSWFLVAYYGISQRTSEYSSMVWNAAEYVALFVIVLMHEFGHSLACRQVGGRADQIVLWPLGGVAYVAPPHRPGATLWSIAAGPLVNLVLFPLLSLAVLAGRSLGWPEAWPDVYTLLLSLWFINLGLLVFNLLPVYPLDGGQILRSLLWFVVGPARSLMAAAVIGMVGVVGLIGLAIWGRSIWLGILAVFILLNCGRGLIQARAMARMEAARRREGYVCPVCRTVPPTGDFWRCGQCQKPFDLFGTGGVCPHCGTEYTAYPCLECGSVLPLVQWQSSGGGSPGGWPEGSTPPRL
ncbi:MAG: site-2 protease family protein [Verrucomicrobia bacterium]|nr:site-2 protease family protein [Verrucomicrobiota bacterium]